MKPRMDLPNFWFQIPMNGNIDYYANIAAIAFFYCLMMISGCTSVPGVDRSMSNRAFEGDKEAQYEMGEVYYRARYEFFGRSNYWEDAARWYFMAANQGDGRAYYRLSQYYFNKHSDYTQSFRWLELPAQQGIAEAQHSLGMHYAQGWGTSQDLILAYKWIMLAFDADIRDPNHKVVSLEWLVSRGQMSSDQIYEARRLAKIHTETYGKSRPLDPGRRSLLEVN